MNNSHNGNGDEPSAFPASTPTADVSRALAEVKEVVGRLWNKVDAVEIASKEEYKRIQEKLDLWVQTNRTLMESNQELIKIIVLNSQETSKSIESSEKGSSLLASLSIQLEQFSQLTKQWQQTLRQQSGTSTPSPSALSQQIHALQASLDSLNQQMPTSLPMQLNDLQTNLSNTNTNLFSVETSTTKLRDALANLRTKKKSRIWSGNTWLLAGLACLMALGWLSLKGDTNYLSDRVNRLMWKLQAIEKRWR